MSVAATVAPTLAGADVGPGPAYRRLADALRLAIADGRILHGARLPSERVLTQQLGLSRTTVTRAYDELRERGYLVSRRGSGTVAVLPSTVAPAAPNVLAPGMLDLTSTAPAAAPGLAAAYTAAADDVAAYLAGGGYDLAGVGELRAAIARRYVERGALTDPGQIVVVPGALAGLGILARALVRPGEPVVVESPTYPGAVLALRRAGARLVGVPPLAGATQATDWISPLAEAVRRGARTAYLIPDAHNPTCATLAADGRTALADLLKRTGVTVIVDETLAELTLDGPPVEPSMATSDRVVCLGSASKTHWGGLRIGWIRAPWPLLDAIRAARLGADLGAPVLDQLVLARALAMGPVVAEDRRVAIRAARDLMVAELRAAVPRWEIPVPTAGLALWCRLPAAASTALAASAERHGALLAPGSSFAAAGRGFEHWMRVPFTLPAAELPAAAAAIGAAWDALAREPGRRPVREESARRLLVV